MPPATANKSSAPRKCSPVIKELPLSSAIGGICRRPGTRPRSDNELPIPAISAWRAQEAVTFSRDKNFEREAVVDQRLLMRDALRRGMGKTTLSQVQQNFDNRSEKGEFLALNPEPIRARKIFHHSRHHSCPNARSFNRCLPGRDDRADYVSSRTASLSLSNPRALIPNRAAAEHVLTSHDRVQGIQGSAGTGKTTALEVIRRASRRQRIRSRRFCAHFASIKAAAPGRHTGGNAASFSGASSLPGLSRGKALVHGG